MDGHNAQLNGECIPPLVTVPLEQVRYDAQTGLVPVVVQHVTSGEILMLAYANREALKRTLGTGQAWFWSRSRQSYWHKGATSGHVQHVREVRIDCDGDAVIYLVEPAGPACHTGERRCFFRTVYHGGGGPASEPVHIAESQGERPSTSEPTTLNTFNPLVQLWQRIEQRDAERPAGSYTTYLFEHGVDKIAKKVGEEATEVVIAAKNAHAVQQAGRAELAAESADLLFHLLTLWKASGISPHEVFSVLQGRFSPE